MNFKFLLTYALTTYFSRHINTLVHISDLMMHSIFELFKTKIRIGYENQPINQLHIFHMIL